jgi:hypothetical protein
MRLDGQEQSGNPLHAPKGKDIALCTLFHEHLGY